MTLRSRFRTCAALAAVAAFAPVAAAQNLAYDIDAGASPFTFGGTSNVGPIVGTPDTFGLDGTFLLDPTYVGASIGAAQFVGGEAVTIPSTLAGEIPSGIPGLPLASLSVRNLRIAAVSPIFAVGGGGAFDTIVTFVVTAGFVDFVPLIGAPGTASIAGLQSDPTPVTGVLTQSPTETRILFSIDTSIPFNEPALGVSGTIDLAGTVDAGYLFVETTCFGDGSGAACPCANESAPGAGAGCLNSLGIGATLVTTGLASVGSDSLLLVGAQMPPTAPVLYFQGTAQAGGGAGTVFGDGLLCAAGGVIRLGAKINSGGASVFPISGASLSVRGEVPPGGATRWYQGWYRNQAPEYCTLDRFNLTNGVRVTWVP